MIAMILLHSESISIYDLYYSYCAVQTWAFLIINTFMMLLWSLQSLLHCENMDVYDPYYIYDSFWLWSLQCLLHSENMDIYDPHYIHDPSDHDLYDPYCIMETWTYMILITYMIFLTMISMIFIIHWKQGHLCVSYYDSYHLYNSYCTLKIWTFIIPLWSLWSVKAQTLMILITFIIPWPWSLWSLMYNKKMDICDPYYIYDAFDHDFYDSYCIPKTSGSLWSSLHPWSLMHNENMDVYDPYYIHNPPDHDLYDPWCIIKRWTFVILVTSMILLTMISMTLIAYWKPDFKQWKFMILTTSMIPDT